METAAYISFSLALRLVASALSQGGDILAGSAIIGLFEGTVLHYTLENSGRSWSSQCWERLLLAMLLAGLGMVLSDVGHVILHPSSECSRCLSKSKTPVSAKYPRRVLAMSKVKPTSHARFMSVPEPGTGISDAASLPDSIDDELEHLHNLPRVLIERATPASPSTPHLIHSIKMTHDPRLQMPDWVPQSSPVHDKLYLSPRTPTVQTPDVIFTVPYIRNLQHSPAPGSASVPEVPFTIPPLEDASAFTEQKSGQQTPTADNSQNGTSGASTPVARASYEPDPNIIAAALASASVPYDDMDDLESEISPPLSIISVKGRDELKSRAETIRREAIDADELRFRLEGKRRRAVFEGKIKEAFLLGQQIRDAEDVAKRLHERAERRYYCAHNLKMKTQEIDLHGLRVREALSRLEKALRDMLLQDAAKLRVIVGKGNHSANKVPVLKKAVIKEMERYKIPTAIDPSNAGVLIIKPPS